MNYCKFNDEDVLVFILGRQLTLQRERTTFACTFNFKAVKTIQRYFFSNLTILKKFEGFIYYVKHKFHIKNFYKLNTNKFHLSTYLKNIGFPCS